MNNSTGEKPGGHRSQGGRCGKRGTARNVPGQSKGVKSQGGGFIPRKVCVWGAMEERDPHVGVCVGRSRGMQMQKGLVQGLVQGQGSFQGVQGLTPLIFGRLAYIRQKQVRCFPRAFPRSPRWERAEKGRSPKRIWERLGTAPSLLQLPSPGEHRAAWTPGLPCESASTWATRSNPPSPELHAPGAGGVGQSRAWRRNQRGGCETGNGTVGGGGSVSVCLAGCRGPQADSGKSKGSGRWDLDGDIGNPGR